tara:strand:+ start:560 stop:1036 length:477 start_codon:yes stop_codon:yes gene_type:complete
MKQKFSTKWIGSRQPRKQRKYRANAPLHLRHKFLSVNLAKDLRTKYSKRNIPIVKGDKVKIMKGEFKSKTGKISIVSNYKLKVAIEGIQKTKKDGTKVNVYFDPSNIQIQELNLEDQKRLQILQRKTPEKKIKKLPKTETKLKDKADSESKTSEGDKK